MQYKGITMFGRKRVTLITHDGNNRYLTEWGISLRFAEVRRPMPKGCLFPTRHTSFALRAAPTPSSFSAK